MTFNGSGAEVEMDGKLVSERQYVYEPFRGLTVVSAIFFDGDNVVGTQVISEGSGGGSSTISDDL